MLKEVNGSSIIHQLKQKRNSKVCKNTEIFNNCQLMKRLVQGICLEEHLQRRYYTRWFIHTPSVSADKNSSSLVKSHGYSVTLGEKIVAKVLPERTREGYFTRGL